MGEDGIRCRSASGTPASALADLAKGGEGAGAALTALKRSVQARYERATWLQVARRLNDRLRQARRDALVAYFKHVVQVHCDEGAAIHIGPEPCGGIREGVGEASAGERGMSALGCRYADNRLYTGIKAELPSPWE